MVFVFYFSKTQGKVMCGISGIILTKSDAEIERHIHLMNSAQNHRGPDANGIFMSKQVALGHTRLSIIDLSETGNQPMHDEGISIVFNGEIYNYKTLRKELEGKNIKFKSSSDTEVLIKGYQEWGIQFIKRLSGMFAFCLFDSIRDKFFLVRDQFGIKPLFYYEDKDKTIFASEIQAIKKVLSPQNLTVDGESILGYLNYLYVPKERTVYKEIKRFPPACYMEIDIQKGKKKLTKYWEIFKPEQYSTLPLKQTINNVEKLLTESVVENLVSDVPVGIFLSGGVDSSLICAIASKLHNTPLNTFSIGYTQSTSFNDESRFAEQVAKQYHTHHKTIKLDVEEVFESIESILDTLDEPIADPSVFLSYILSKEASKYVKVCMSGLGGDELFGGYNRYQALLFTNSFQKIPSKLHSLLSITANQFSANRNSKIGNLARASQKMLSVDVKDVKKIYPQLISYLDQEYMNKTYDVLNIDIPYNDLNDIMIWDINNYMINDLLFLSDQTSMQNSLELRVPFLNTGLAEYAFSIPPKYKTSITSKKIILKKLAERHLPKNIVYRRKQGFSVSLDPWLKNMDLTTIRDMLFSSKMIKFVPESYIKVCLDNYYVQNKDASMQLYALFVLSKWLEKN